MNRASQETIGYSWESALAEFLETPAPVHLEHINEYDYPDDPGYSLIAYTREKLSAIEHEVAEHYQLPVAIVAETFQLLRAFGFLPQSEFVGKRHDWKYDAEQKLPQTAQHPFILDDLPGIAYAKPRQESVERVLYACMNFFERLSSLLAFPSYAARRNLDLNECFLQTFPREFFGKMSYYDFGTHITSMDVEEVLNSLLAPIDAKKRFVRGDLEQLYDLLPSSGLQIYSKNHQTSYPIAFHAPFTTITNPRTREDEQLYFTIGNQYGDTQLLLMCTVKDPGMPIYFIGTTYTYDEKGNLICRINTCQSKSKNTVVNTAGELEYAPQLEPIFERPMGYIKELLDQTERELHGHLSHYLMAGWEHFCRTHGIQCVVDNPETNLWLTEHLEPGTRTSTITGYNKRYRAHGLEETSNGYKTFTGDLAVQRNIQGHKVFVPFLEEEKIQTKKTIPRVIPACSAELAVHAGTVVHNIFDRLGEYERSEESITERAQKAYTEVREAVRSTIMTVCQELLSATPIICRKVSEGGTAIEQGFYLSVLKKLTGETWEEIKTVVHSLTEVYALRAEFQGKEGITKEEQQETMKHLSQRQRMAEQQLIQLLTNELPRGEEIAELCLQTMNTHTQLCVVSQKEFPFSIEQLLTLLTK